VSVCVLMIFGVSQGRGGRTHTRQTVQRRYQQQQHRQSVPSLPFPLLPQRSRITHLRPFLQLQDHHGVLRAGHAGLQEEDERQERVPSWDEARAEPWPYI